MAEIIPKTAPTKRLQHVLMTAAALTLLTVGGLTLTNLLAYRFLTGPLTNLLRVKDLQSSILVLDEAMSMSVRLSAATGNAGWEARYRELEPQLDDVLKEILELAPAYRQPAMLSDGANGQRVALDRRTFELVRRGQPEAAEQLLSGQAYQAQKDDFAAGVAELRRLLQVDVDSVRELRKVRLQWSLAIAGIVTPLLVLGWSLVMRAARQSQAVIVEGNQQLRRRTAELAEVNNQLDARVRERTKALDDSVLATLNMMEDAVRQRENAERALEKLKHEERVLEQTHKQLLEASRQAGMAEVATSILHNVGNVLNSVNVSAGLVTENVRNSVAAGLARVVALLREHATDLGSFVTTDPKGQHLPAFLEQLAQESSAQQQLVIRELDSLRANIDHIKVIVAMQQGYAKVAGATETVDVRALIEHSVRMNEASLIRHAVKIVREFDDVPPISVEKHKVLQILVNLVRNAKDACDDMPEAAKLITLRVGQCDGRIRISVSDNGSGIASENLTRIFGHGFTTRKDGHGFGLHNGSLTAVEMGGSLSAHSEGPGKGATFTLELPQQPPGARS